jgi:hypothetical protein
MPLFPPIIVFSIRTKNPNQKYLKFSPHPLPLPSGERGRVRGQNVRDKFSDFIV